jgi:hypothetical protein
MQRNLSAQGDPVFVSPRKKINMPKKVTNLDDFNKDVVRRTVLDFYDRGEIPSVKKYLRSSIKWDIKAQVLQL